LAYLHPSDFRAVEHLAAFGVVGVKPELAFVALVDVALAAEEKPEAGEAVG
jgi:hypothetical protein